MNGLSDRSGTDKRSSYDRPLNRVVQISKKSGGYYFKGLSIWCPKLGVVGKKLACYVPVEKLMPIDMLKID